MRILVVGGSRGIGRQVVIEALRKGHSVSVFSRRPSALKIDHPKLTIYAGNVLDPPSLVSALKEIDAVICTLGLSSRQAIGPPFTKPSHVLSFGTKNILNAMTNAQVKRFICVTAIGTNESAKQCSFITRLTLRKGLGWLYEEKDKQEKLIRKQSGIDWTIIRPTALTNAKAKGVEATNNIRVGFFTHVSRADVASYMVSVLGKQSTYGETSVLSYPPKLGDSLRYLAHFF